MRDKTKFIELFTQLVAKYNLDNYLIYQILALLSRDNKTTLSDETMAEFDYHLKNVLVRYFFFF